MAGDRDTTDETDATTSQNAEIAGDPRRDAMVTNVKQRRKKNQGRNAMSVDTTTKRINATTATDATTTIVVKNQSTGDNRYTSSDNEKKNNDNNTYVDDDNALKSMASSDADDDNFAVALGTPAKGAKK
jgi:hypothetical protein